MTVCCISSYIGWGFPLASHSMTIVSLGSTICSFIDCFTMVGGCLTAGRDCVSNRGDEMMHIMIKTHFTDSPSRGMSREQTRCHRSSSSADLTSVTIFAVHGIQQNLSSPVLMFWNWPTEDMDTRTEQIHSDLQTKMEKLGRQLKNSAEKWPPWLLYLYYYWCIYTYFLDGHGGPILPDQKGL